ncbi:MAG: hypothetical protein ORN54_10210 [Cyclobacteriaceae bacterium]|nr:hypothetical protein [Cyclobacteriaceae bacterium]
MSEIKKEFELSLLKVTSKEIIYEVRMEDCLGASSQFVVAKDAFDGNVFESDHFIKQLNRAVFDLQLYNPQYHQELIKALYERH